MNCLPAAISVSAVSITISTVVVTVISISAVVIAISRALGSIAIIYQVDITEIPVVVLATIAVASVGRVAGTRGTGLHVAVAIGAEDEGIVITEVETIIAALAGVAAIVGVGGRGRSHEGEDDDDLHVYSLN